MANGPDSIWSNNQYVEHIARESLTIYPKKQPTYAVTVTSKVISCIPEGLNSSLTEKRKIEYNFNDVVGCDCLRGQKQGDVSAYLVLYIYPHQKKLASKKTQRKRVTLTLIFNQMLSFGENERAANKWKDMISAIIEGISIQSINDLSRIQIPDRKRLLVLVNPHSGPGKALNIFQEKIVPVFAEAGIYFNLIVTEYAGHAVKIIHTISLSEWYGIAIVSGDGLIYEVINGLMQRNDWEEAIKMPLAVLPGGSGNALACSINYYAGEPFKSNAALHSSFIVARHQVLPMDLVAVDTIKERVYSFLSFTWGLVADVDIESEKYRNFGSARFTIGAIARILNLRVYRGRLSFLPVEPYTEKARLTRSQSAYPAAMQEDNHPANGPTRSQSVIEVEEILRQKKHFAKESMSTEEDENVRDIENSQANDDNSEEDLDLDRVTITVNSTNGNSNGVSDEPKLSSPKAEMNGACFDAELSSSARVDDNGPRPEVPTPLLPPLNDPVPSDWVTIEDDFVYFVASYQSHLANDYVAHPDSTLNDGLIYLAFIRNKPPGMRKKILSLLTKTEDGTQRFSPDYEIVKVKAFRLVPLTEQGILSIDGERVDYGPIQAQILPGMARVMAMPRRH